MITIQDFIDSGYTKYNQTFKNSDCLLQKCVRTNSRIKNYFINIYVYDYSKWPFYSGVNKIVFSAEVQFSSHDDRIFNVTFSVTDKDTVKTIEDFFAFTYKRLYCIPDIHNND
jgi:hypothetical protein